MNYLAATLAVKMTHKGLSDEALLRIMWKMAKAAKGKSTRGVQIMCGNLFVSFADEIECIPLTPKKK